MLYSCEDCKQIKGEVQVWNKKKLLLYAFIIHADARLQKLWENIWLGCIWKLFKQGQKQKLQINQDAVRIMKELYGIDMEAEGQYSKLIDEIPVTEMCNFNGL